MSHIVKNLIKAHTRAKRLLKRMEKQMERASGLLSERTLDSALRSSGGMIGKMTHTFKL